MAMTKAGDLNIEYYEEGSGPPLLLIMGLGGQASSWGEPLLEQLQAHFRTIRFSNRLFDEGVFGTSVVFPTVALDRARIRTIVTAAHTDELLDRALAAFDTVGRELGVIAG